MCKWITLRSAALEHAVPNRPSYYKLQSQENTKTSFMIETKRIKGTAQISHLYWLCFWCAHSHLFPLTTKSMILLYCVHANWTHFFHCVPNTLILPFPSFTKPFYISWRCTPSSVHLLLSGLLQRRGQAFPLTSPLSSSFLGEHFHPVWGDCILLIAWCISCETGSNEIEGPENPMLCTLHKMYFLLH